MQTIKEWVKENYEPQAIKDITEHGMISGFGSLIYYKDTCEFHDKFEEQIWDMLYEDAQDQGCTIIELMSQFNGQKDVGSMDKFKNMLCWYAVEKVCDEIVREQEEAD